MNTTAFEIRRAEPRDAAAVASVHHDSWEGAYSGLIPHGALRRMLARRGKDWWANAIANRGSILVADFHGEVVGYSTLGRNRTHQLPADGEIYELYVGRMHQGLGIGTRLFDASRRMLAGHGMDGLAVWALEDNRNACDFYAGKGGRDVAEGTETFDRRTLRKIAYLWK